MGLFRSIGRFLFGRKPRVQQVPRFTSGQESALSRLLSAGMSDTDPAALESRYKNLFERDIVPGLAERFTSMGGGQRSSGFEESLRRGGGNLSEQLAGLRMQSGMQKLGYGLQPRFDNVMTPGSPGLLGGLGGGLGTLLGGQLGGMLGGGMGGGQQQSANDRLIRSFSSRYAPGQPQGVTRGLNPILLRLLEGIEL